MLINAGEHRHLHLMPIDNRAMATRQSIIELTDTDLLSLA